MGDDDNCWLVEHKSPGARLVVAPPPSRADCQRRADELVTVGVWKRERTAGGEEFFYNASQPRWRTWDLAEWVSHELVLGEASSPPRMGHPTAQLSTFSPETDEWRKKVIELYSRFNPSKLLVVDELLARYRGREAELWRNLMSKYGGLPTSDGPSFSSPATPLRDLHFTPSTSFEPPFVTRATQKVPDDKASPEAEVRVPVPQAAPSPSSTVRVSVDRAAQADAERKARALLDGNGNRNATSTRSTPLRRTTSPLLAKSSSARSMSPATAAKSKLPSDDPGWSADLQRRQSDVAARRETIAAQRRSAREQKERNVTARLEVIRTQREQHADPISAQPLARTKSAGPRERVSLVDRQAVAAQSLRDRYATEAPPADSFDASSPAQSRGWHVARQIQYTPRS
jgi:hypothetical protein